MILSVNDRVGNPVNVGDRVIFMAGNKSAQLYKGIVAKVHNITITAHKCNEDWEMYPATNWGILRIVKPGKFIKV